MSNLKESSREELIAQLLLLGFRNLHFIVYDRFKTPKGYEWRSERGNEWFSIKVLIYSDHVSTQIGGDSTNYYDADPLRVVPWLIHRMESFNGNSAFSNNKPS
jgi:hypothetical protein